MALTPEVVVGSLLGVIVGALVTENQKVGIPGGTYGGAAIGGVLGGIAGRVIFGAEEVKTAPVAQAPVAAPQPQVIVVQQPTAPVAAPAPPERVVYREGPPQRRDEFEDMGLPEDAASAGYHQFGQPVIIGRAHSGRSGYVGATRSDVREVRRDRRVEELRNEPPRRRMTLADAERAARAGQRLLAEQMPEELDFFDDEGEAEPLPRTGRIVLGRY